jgi:hypothetical protein
MKKTPKTSRSQSTPDDIRPEYDFDYGKARPNRFAGRIGKERLIVMLDPDVSQVFTTPESVNTVLRALITTMPRTGKRSTVRKSPLRKTKRVSARLPSRSPRRAQT